MKCSQCGCTEVDFDPGRGSAVCVACGFVLEENTIVAEVEFAEIGGRSTAVGQFVAAGGKGRGLAGVNLESREATIQNAKQKMQQLASVMGLSTHHVEAAHRLFMLALQHNFLHGRKSQNVAAACLYIVCRREKTSHMLLDFSEQLQVNHYQLGHTFVLLVRLLNITLPVVDPSLYIHRFAARLDLGDKTHQVSSYALKLVSSMQRDWLQTGRRPSGVCAAALLIAARVHGFHRTQREVVDIVKCCDMTLRKRLIEFGNTPSALLSPEEFETVDVDVASPSVCLPPILSATGSGSGTSLSGTPRTPITQWTHEDEERANQEAEELKKHKEKENDETEGAAEGDGDGGEETNEKSKKGDKKKKKSKKGEKNTSKKSKKSKEKDDEEEASSNGGESSNLSEATVILTLSTSGAESTQQAGPKDSQTPGAGGPSTSSEKTSDGKAPATESSTAAAAKRRPSISISASGATTQEPVEEQEIIPTPTILRSELAQFLEDDVFKNMDKDVDAIVDSSIQFRRQMREQEKAEAAAPSGGNGKDRLTLSIPQMTPSRARMLRAIEVPGGSSSIATDSLVSASPASISFPLLGEEDGLTSATLPPSLRPPETPTTEVAGGESGEPLDTLDDLMEDAELDKYLVKTDEEKKAKEALWVEMNREYIKEQEEKEAEREANGGVEPEKKKRKKRKKAEEEGPASSAAEGVARVLKKRSSTKIDYFKLQNLFNVDTTVFAARASGGSAAAGGPSSIPSSSPVPMLTDPLAFQPSREDIYGDKPKQKEKISVFAPGVSTTSYYSAVGGDEDLDPYGLSASGGADVADYDEGDGGAYDDYGYD